MYLCYVSDFALRPCSFKCETIPTNGHGNPIVTLAKFELTADEFKLRLNELMRLYPCHQKK